MSKWVFSSVPSIYLEPHPLLSHLSLWQQLLVQKGRKGKIVTIKSLDTYTVWPNLLSRAATGTDCDQKLREDEKDYVAHSL